VLSLPALDDLAASYPEAALTVMVRPSFVELLRGRPSLARVVGVPEGETVEELSWRIAGHRPDLGIDLSGPDDLLAVRAMALARVPRRVGLAGGGREVLLTDPVHAQRGHLTEIHAALVVRAGGRNSGAPPLLNVSAGDDREAENLLRVVGAAGRPRIAIHPGGYYPSQRWPLSRFAEAGRRLADRFDGGVVLLGGPGDESALAELAARLGERATRVPPLGLTSLAAVMSRCDLLLANNSGPVHLAGAVGLPAVSTLGPTDAVRFHPLGPHQVTLRVPGLRCSPCTRGRCRAHDCMTGIDVDEMVDAAVRAFECARPGERPMEAAG
jgi:heptosyltransferase-2